MRWLPLEVVQAPEADLPLTEVRQFLAQKSDQTESDGTLNFLRRGVVEDFEFRLKRAIFPQTRRFTAYFGDCERARRTFHFERFEDGRAGTVAPVVKRVRDGVETDVAFNAAARFIIDFDTWFRPMRGDLLTFELRCGFPVPIPEDLRLAMLSEVQRRFERIREVGADSEKELNVPLGAGFRDYRAFNEPLEPYLVEAGGGY